MCVLSALEAGVSMRTHFSVPWGLEQELCLEMKVELASGPSFIQQTKVGDSHEFCSAECSAGAPTHGRNETVLPDN